ncbi:hypothetical protein VP01_10777g1, partial [Puccinia sorghi]
HILGTAAYGQRPIHIDLGQGLNGSLGDVVIDPQPGVPTRLAPGQLSCWPNFNAPSYASQMVRGGTSLSKNHLLFRKIISRSENPAKIQWAIFPDGIQKKIKRKIENN